MKFNKEHILDELLILRIQDGDMKSFSLLYQRWHPKLYKHAFYMTRDNEGTKDVVQEAWQGITRGIRKLKDPSAFKTWAYRIVNNKSANWIKDQQRQRKLNSIAELNDVETEGDTPERIDVVRNALNEMPGKSRILLSLFYMESYSVKEIASVTGLSQGTVKSRLFYARKLLKEKIEDYEKGR